MYPEWNDFTDYEHMGYQWFFADGEEPCMSCGSDMVMVEIADYQCPTCGDYILWGETGWTKQGPKPIAFEATVYKVQTLVDGGLRITLDLPETAIEAAAKLMAC